MTKKTNVAAAPKVEAPNQVSSLDEKQISPETTGMSYEELYKKAVELQEVNEKLIKKLQAAHNIITM